MQWIDQNELYNDLNRGIDFYDGALDISTCSLPGPVVASGT